MILVCRIFVGHIFLGRLVMFVVTALSLLSSLLLGWCLDSSSGGGCLLLCLLDCCSIFRSLLLGLLISLLSFLFVFGICSLLLRLDLLLCLLCGSLDLLGGLLRCCGRTLLGLLRHLLVCLLRFRGGLGSLLLCLLRFRGGLLLSLFGNLLVFLGLCSSFHSLPLLVFDSFLRSRGLMFAD